MIKMLELTISGRVQGIGFRAYALRIAQNLDIKGSVRNLPDGRVRVIALAEEDDLELFIQKLRNGPTFSLVREVLISEMEVTDTLKDFRIEY